MRSTARDIGRQDRQLCDLLAALEELATPAAVDLADRLSRCRTARFQRRGDVVSAMQWSYRCRSVACWACARSRIARKADQMATAFSQANNSDCSLLTICLSRTSDLNALSTVVQDTRKRIRNIRDRLAMKDRRWNNLEVRGAMEVDAIDPSDLMLLPPKRRALIPELPVVGDEEGAVWWLPHLHLCVHHPAVDRAELRAAFERAYPSQDRVDVTAFHTDLGEVPEGFSDAEVNAFCATRYALVQSCETSFSDPFGQGQSVQICWPMSWQAHYFSWLHECGRSLQTLQVVIKPRGSRRLAAVASCPPVEVEPMPILF